MPLDHSQLVRLRIQGTDETPHGPTLPRNISFHKANYRPGNRNNKARNVTLKKGATRTDHKQPKSTKLPAVGNPSQATLDLIEHRAGPGDSRGCPELTACTLGLHEDSGGSVHPEVIWFHTNHLVPEDKARCGIPRDWHQPYVLDTIDFDVAAHLLRKHPDLLQSECPCTR